LDGTGQLEAEANRIPALRLPAEFGQNLTFN